MLLHVHFYSIKQCLFPFLSSLFSFPSLPLSFSLFFLPFFLLSLSFFTSPFALLPFFSLFPFPSPSQFFSPLPDFKCPRGQSAPLPSPHWLRPWPHLISSFQSRLYCNWNVSSFYRVHLYSSSCFWHHFENSLKTRSLQPTHPYPYESLSPTPPHLTSNIQNRPYCNCNVSSFYRVHYHLSSCFCI